MDDNGIATASEEIVGTDDGFMDGWEETNSTGEEPESESGAGPGGDQAARNAENDPQGDAGHTEAGQSGDADNAEGGDQVPGGQQEPPPRTWTLNHLGQAVTASEADMVTLAQKGLDYDRIRGEYDEAKPVMAMFREYAGKAGMDLKGYLAHIRAQAKQAEGMSEQEARRAVELEDREAVVAAREEIRRSQEMADRQELARRQAADARMQADLREFREVFPDAAADPASIPKEVWAEVRGGRSLVGAYARYHEAKVRADADAAAQKAAAQRQNAENAARSAGSMRSAGAEAASRDPFLEGWNE